MKEKKVNRVLLYLLGFLCGHSAVDLIIFFIVD